MQKLSCGLFALLLFCSCAKEQMPPAPATTGAASATSAYEQKLVALKPKLTFQDWRSRTHFVAIFDRLITDLVAAGERASEEQKIACFQRAVAALNDLSRKDQTLIATIERENLCMLLGRVGIAAGMPPSKFPDEEGAASGREW